MPEKSKEKIKTKSKQFREILAKSVEYFIVVSMIILTICSSIYFGIELTSFIKKYLA